MYVSSASFTRMVTTYSPPVFLTTRMRSPTVPNAYVFMIAVESDEVGGELCYIADKIADVAVAQVAGLQASRPFLK